jgi:hypothetical protein
VSQPPLSAREFGAAFKGFLEEATTGAPVEEPFFAARLRAHLGADPVTLAVVGQEFAPTDRPNVQVALSALLDGRPHELVGFTAPYNGLTGITFNTLLQRPGPGLPGGGASPAPVRYVDVDLGDDEVLSCLDSTLILAEGPLAILVAAAPRNGPFGGTIGVQALAPEREQAEEFVAALRRELRERNVYRGRVVSLQADRTAGVGVRFHRLPEIDRDSIVLGEGVLERVERQTVVFDEQVERLAAARRHLRRGLLLHGPPGTGKTMTTMYVAGRLEGRTVILLTGMALGLIEQSVTLARMLQPSLVVLEDVDLVAEERTQQGTGTNAVLFELLNQMDGLADDADVIFLLTTNRPDLLEPALASRPGRIDLAIEVPLPDADARRRLIALYADGMTVELERVDELVERTEGVSAAFIRELLRKAALLAAEATVGELVVRDEHLDLALRELVLDGGALTRSLLGAETSSGADRRRC